jgi:hypothetical protein
MSVERIAAKFEAAQNALVLQASDLSLETIAKMVESQAIDVSPKYQRRDRWKQAAQAGLIESFLMNVPVPPVYLAEDDFGTYSVIDGKQRITTVYRFLREEFALEGLRNFPEVNGMRFSELPIQLRNALSIRPYLRVVTLLKQTDPGLKYEVFTRLNTGGEPLLPQEIRNALYRGPLNDLLFELGDKGFLKRQLKIESEKDTPFKEMQDVESVLRFLCLSEEWGEFSGDMRRSMDAYAARNQTLKKASVQKSRDLFTKALDRCQVLWGDEAFRRFDKTAYRDQFMSAVYDAQMIAASELSETRFRLIKGTTASLARETKKLFNDQKFVDAVRVSTNSPSKVLYRITKVKDMLARVR